MCFFYWADYWYAPDLLGEPFLWFSRRAKGLPSWHTVTASKCLRFSRRVQAVAGSGGAADQLIS